MQRRHKMTLRQVTENYVGTNSDTPSPQKELDHLRLQLCTGDDPLCLQQGF